MDKVGRHRFGLSMELSVRKAGGLHMALQKKPSRMAKKERIPEDLRDEFVLYMYTQEVLTIKNRIKLEKRQM